MSDGRDGVERGTSTSVSPAEEPTTGGATADQAADPSDAFSALGGEARLGVVRALDERSPRTFSDLFAASDEDTSAGFAYHLRQLTDRFVRQRDDERYELTDAGRSAARALNAGTYTASVDCEPIPVEEDCPFCGEAALVATVEDNVAAVGCERCDTTVLRLPFPPGGHAGRDAAALPAALDAHHRRRIESFDDGVCPECAGRVSGRIEPVGDEDRESLDRRPTDEADDYTHVRTVYECETCGVTLRCPVALTVLDHPAVVSFYHDHGRDVRDRPVWNVGTEWRERAVSRDPWCVVVSVRLDGEDLVLYVAGDGTIVDHRRHTHDDSDGPGEGVGLAGLDADAGRADAEHASRDDSPRGEDTGAGEATA